jgi:hypothetical protein
MINSRERQYRVHCAATDNEQPEKGKGRGPDKNGKIRKYNSGINKTG